MNKFSEKQKESLRIAAIRFGENLTASDCANIIRKRYCIKTRKAIGVRGIANMIQDMMLSALIDSVSPF